MDPFIEKLNEYGLCARGILRRSKVESITDSVKKCIGNDWGGIDLNFVINSLVEIFVEDPVVFKEKFQIPQRYETLFPFVLQELSLEIEVANDLLFYFNSNELEIENSLKSAIKNGEAEYLKNNRAYALKKIFHKDQSIQELASLQNRWAEELVNVTEDPNSKEQVNQVLKNLSTELNAILSTMVNQLKEERKQQNQKKVW